MILIKKKNLYSHINLTNLLDTREVGDGKPWDDYKISNEIETNTIKDSPDYTPFRDSPDYTPFRETETTTVNVADVVTLYWWGSYGDDWMN